MCGLVDDRAESFGVDDGPDKEGDGCDGDDDGLEVEEETDLARVNANEWQRDEREEEERDKVHCGQTGAFGGWLGMRA